ncbi:MAG: hypothetical protein KF777_15745 [Planctomycetaceae bacterium]|nr:hypothetical protein [Planctomycetaceae bacterium]
MSSSPTSRAIGGSPITPRPGDQILRSGGLVYRVEPIPGEQCYRIDGTGQRIRVHAKKIGG